MEYYRRRWFYIGGILFVGLAFFMGFWEMHLSQIQIIIVYSFMAMLVHQIEEYVYPGGFPPIANSAMFKEKDALDRYPLNANQCLISNVFLTYPFYIIPIFFPNIIWLGVGVVGLGLFQIVAHCVLENILLKRFYNPGCATSVFLFLPLGIYYIRYVKTNHLANTTDFVVGSAITLAAVVVLFLLPIILLKNKNSKYPFTEIEMTGMTKLIKKSRL